MLPMLPSKALQLPKLSLWSFPSRVVVVQEVRHNQPETQKE